MNNENQTSVWPASWKRNDSDVTVGGCSLHELAQEYGTPLFIYDEQDFRDRCRVYARAFGGKNVHYASKAFLSLDIASWVKEEGLALDVCSYGELFIALQAGFPAQDITLHGNNKSVTELEYAIDNNIGFIAIDSQEEIARLESVAAAKNVVQEVLLRLTPGVATDTHEYISTAHEDQKFGFSIAAGSAQKAVESILACPHIKLVGFHSHIGSQLFDKQGFEQAADKMGHFLADLHSTLDEQTSKDIQYMDLGGGIGIAYLPEHKPLAVDELAHVLLEKAEQLRQKFNIPHLTVQVEPGRSIIGPTGITLYTVGTNKKVTVAADQYRNYISVDGGMSDNIRPALYDARYYAEPITQHSQDSYVSSRVVGKHCESGDIIIFDIPLPDDIKAGELLAVAATGAYCYTMSSRYNALPRPAVVAVKNGTSRLLLRRETPEDLLSLETQFTTSSREKSSNH